MKNHFSHVNRSCWHFRLTEEVWSYRASNSKACTYYWFKVPLALLATGLFYIFLSLWYVVGWFCGYQPKIKDVKSGEYNGGSSLFYPYKISAKGRKRRVAPWETIVFAIAIYLAYYFLFENTVSGIAVASTLGMLILIGCLVFLARRGWKLPTIIRLRSGLALAWDRVCPPLVVEDDGKT